MPEDTQTCKLRRQPPTALLRFTYMWAIIVLFVFGIVVLWIIAMNLDEKFFGGRFLVRDKMTREELLLKLHEVLEHKDSHIDNLPPDIEYWFFDYFYNVALYDTALYEIRKPIIDSIKTDSNTKSFSSATIDEIEKAIQKLKA